GEGVTIFFSMGKRQRIFPRTLIDLILEKGGVALEDIGEVRAFDNYSFADIAPAKASALVASLDGTELRGRKLSVSLAKRRDESAT
ncbi:MAG TPA: DbpA RNA binding domain-containing protein, partial [Rectinemataceae bacterium]|nr:DbpA RNA binding domain-containing protein [Rectinemataceae bacterium]